MLLFYANKEDFPTGEPPRRFRQPFSIHVTRRQSAGAFLHLQYSIVLVRAQR